MADTLILANLSTVLQRQDTEHDNLSKSNNSYHLHDYSAKKEKKNFFNCLIINEYYLI